MSFNALLEQVVKFNYLTNYNAANVVFWSAAKLQTIQL